LLLPERQLLLQGGQFAALLEAAPPWRRGGSGLAPGLAWGVASGGGAGGAKGKKQAEKPVSSNIWQFLARNERGSTFELQFFNPYDEETTPSSSNVNKKYITLN
jgi:hypothetical protein